MIRKLLDRRGPFSPWRRSPYETKFGFTVSCAMMIGAWVVAGLAMLYAVWGFIFHG